MFKKLLKISLKLFTPVLVGLVLFTLLNVSCNSSKNTPALSDTVPLRNNLIAGINLEAPPDPIDSSGFLQMKTLNANWVAFIPFAFSRQEQPLIIYNDKKQWWGETEAGIIACIKLAHAQNMKVMLKPQLWIGGGVYTGHFKMNSDTGWLHWENNYEQYILQHALIAQNNGVELFCIGTEMDEAVKQRPLFWDKLIDNIKKIYKGKLTYAANWNCFNQFKSWSKLDFIGVDAYFPLSKKLNPTVNELTAAWEPHYNDLKAFTIKEQKPVLFTEYGYRSADKTTAEPWSSYHKAALNYEAQQNAYEALYRRFMPEQWFAGGFVWKWHVNERFFNKKDSTDYTPQNKPAAATIKKWYATK